MERQFRSLAVACVMALTLGLVAEARGIRPGGRARRVGTRAFSRRRRTASGREFRAHKATVKPSMSRPAGGAAVRRPGVGAGSGKSSVWFDVDRGKPGIIDHGDLGIKPTTNPGARFGGRKAGVIDNGEPGIIDNDDLGFRPTAAPAGGYGHGLGDLDGDGDLDAFRPGAMAGTRPTMGGMDSETEIIEVTRRRVSARGASPIRKGAGPASVAGGPAGPASDSDGRDDADDNIDSDVDDFGDPEEGDPDADGSFRGESKEQNHSGWLD
jgi:hypothetical protein